MLVLVPQKHFHIAVTCRHGKQVWARAIVPISFDVAVVPHAGKLLGGPRVQRDTLDLSQMGAQAAVHPATPDAQEYAQVV